MSEATEIYESDGEEESEEYSDSDQEVTSEREEMEMAHNLSGTSSTTNSARRSVESFGHKSNKSDTTLSSYDEVLTPISPIYSRPMGLALSSDKKPSQVAAPVEGPRGPHLFRTSSISSQNSAQHFQFELTLSPLTPAGEALKSPTEPPTAIQEKPPMPGILRNDRPISALTEAISRLDPAEVHDWTPDQVADWMYENGFEEAIVEKFKVNDISGAILVDLKFEDLKELDITSFGQRHKVWNRLGSIRRTANNTPVGTPIEGPRGGRASLLRQSYQTPRRMQPQWPLSSSSSEEESSPKKKSWTAESPRKDRKYLNARDIIVSPSDSVSNGRVSIIAIEEGPPLPHKCSKGDRCKHHKKVAKEPWNKRDLIQPGTPGTPGKFSEVSENGPSVLASSDVLGPSALPQLKESELRGLGRREPQERVKHFLKFQHMGLLPHDDPATPPLDFCPSLKTPKTPMEFPKTPMEMFPPLDTPKRTAPLQQNLQQLPRLNIPAGTGVVPPPRAQSAGPSAGPVRPPRDWSVTPASVYRTGTPFSEFDVPVTAVTMEEPSRQFSQSVPPDMSRARQRSRTPSWANAVQPIFQMSKLDENAEWQRSEYDEQAEMQMAMMQQVVRDPNAPQHAGWMKKRKTKLLRHEWQDHHFRLRGTRLAMHRDESTPFEQEAIDVDEYSVACASAANNKLGAAFRSMKLSGRGKKDMDDTAFTFQLVPEAEKQKKLGGGLGKTHHFAVKTKDDRIDWMRELMLAKALGKKSEGFEVAVNGNMI
jgi:hypothetical protein